MADGPGFRSHDSFVEKLLTTMGTAAELSGMRNVRQRMTDLGDGTTPSEAKVLDARFTLGGDDGAYLRTNVMPLQTTDDDYDIASSKLLPQLEMAGRTGVLDALEQRLRAEAGHGWQDPTGVPACRVPANNARSQRLCR